MDQSDGLNDAFVGTVAPGERRVRLHNFVLMRWIAVAGQTATIMTVVFVFDFAMPLAWSLAVVSISAWLNVYLMAVQDQRRLLTDWEAAAQLAFDVCQLATLLAINGGLENPFSTLLAASVVIGFTALPTLQALFIAGLGVFASLLIWLFHRPLPWGPLGFDPPALYEAGHWVALVTAAGFISVFAWRSALETRRMSMALAVTQAVLAREQKLSALGGLAAAAAHELGTPLGTLYMTAKEMARFLPRGTALRDDADLLVSQAERCRELLQQLSRRGAEGDAVHARLSLRELLREVVQPLSDIGPRVTVRLDGAGAHEGGPRLRRLPELLYAIGNYVENAIDYAQSEVVVTGRWDEERMEIEVRDDGDGFAADVLNKLGEPYVSRRGHAPESGGLGLGFFIAQTFVERTGGRVSFRNAPAPGRGAVVTARWPRSRIEADAIT